MPTKEEIAKKRTEIIKQISVELDTCSTNTGCTIPRSTYESPDITCKDCPIYERIREEGDKLDNLCAKQGATGIRTKKAMQARLYTEDEDQIILDYFAKYGGYHGIVADIARELKRPPNSVHSRVKSLIKNKVLIVEEKKK